MKLSNSIKKIYTAFLSSVRRFPIPLLMAMGTVVVLIGLTHLDSIVNTSQPQYMDVKNILTRIARILALGFPVFLCVSMLVEKIHDSQLSKKLIYIVTAYVAAIALLTAYYLLFIPDNLEMVTASRYIAVSIAFYIAFTIIPYFYNKQGYELYIVRIFTKLFITYLYSVVLYLGLTAIIFTVDKLFNANISWQIYTDIMLVMMFVFAPMYFLADLPKIGQRVNVESYPNILKILLLYIVLPMITVYSAILYVYFAKILITWTWPSIMVSNLILWFSLISAFVIFFIYVFRDTNNWARLSVSYLPKVLLPLLAMMFIAMMIRINAYGVTEDRYFVMVAGIWVTLYMIYIAVIKKPNNLMALLLLSALMILSVFGPWSSYSVSISSQNSKLESILTKYNMLKDGKVVKSTIEISTADKIEITNKVKYFNTVHSLTDIRCLPLGFDIKQASNVFGFELGEYMYMVNAANTSDTVSLSYWLDKNMLADIAGYQYFYNKTYGAATETVQGPIKMSYSDQADQLKISNNAQNIYTGNLKDIKLKVCSNIININKSFPAQQSSGRKQSEMSFVDENNSVKVLYIFNSINGTENVKSGEVSNATSNEYYVFVKIK